MCRVQQPMYQRQVIIHGIDMVGLAVGVGRFGLY